MAADTKDRLMQTSSELFRRQGFAGTGVKQIVDKASAPFASLYHFFPKGKAQLGAEVIRWSGAIYGQLIDEFFVPDADPASATLNFFAGAAQVLRDTDYADACPIATVALEVSSTNEPMRQACAEVFATWIDSLTERFVSYGLARRRSRSIAISLLAALEGAFVLARALRSTEPLDTAGQAVTASVREAFTAPRTGPRAHTSRAPRDATR